MINQPILGDPCIVYVSVQTVLDDDLLPEVIILSVVIGGDDLFVTAARFTASIRRDMIGAC